MRSTKQPRQVNLDKFKDVQSDILDAAAHTWVLALQNVKTEPSNILDHPESELLRGYALPDPFLFLNSFNNDKDRFSKLLYVWLAIRAAWIARMTSQDCNSDKSLTKMPLPQHWRDFLIKVGQSVGILGSGTAEVPSSEPQTHMKQTKKKMRKEKMRKEKFLEEANGIFDLVLDLGGTLPDLYWRGSIIKHAAAPITTLPPLPLIKEILWEIIENNWQLELLGLDHCLMSHRQMSVKEAGLRDKKVGSCFPASEFLVGDFPIWDSSLGAKQPHDRLPFLNAFIEIMSCWPIPEAEDLRCMRISESNKNNPGYQFSVEKLAFCVYCQTFFNYFGRAPTIPQPLPLVLRK